MEKDILQTYLFSLEGLECPDCAAKIENIVSQIPGVEQARINFARSIIELEGVKSKDLDRKIMEQIKRLGYGIELTGNLEGEKRLKRPRWKKDIRILLTLLCGILLLFGFISSFLPNPFPYLTLPFYCMVIVFGGYHIARKGLYAAYNLALDMNFLMSIAVLGAIIIGEWLEGATVGIAMGTAGSDTALETADIALMADDLTKLPFAIALSHKALRIIKQNIAFSMLLKGIFLGLSFPGWATLWMAVGADMGASLAVIFNGLRLLKSGENL